jgi:hypothetical protein
MTGINFIPVRREKTFRNLIPVKAAARIGRRHAWQPIRVMWSAP